MKELQKEFESELSKIRTAFNSSGQSSICGNPEYNTVAVEIFKTINKIGFEISSYGNPQSAAFTGEVLLGLSHLLGVLTIKENKNKLIVDNGYPGYALLTPEGKLDGFGFHKLGCIDGLNMRIHETMPYMKQLNPKPNKNLKQLLVELETNLTQVWEQCERLIVAQLISDSKWQDNVKELQRICIAFKDYIPQKEKLEIDSLTNFIKGMSTNLKNEEKPKGRAESARNDGQKIKLFTPQAIIVQFSHIKSLVEPYAGPINQPKPSTPVASSLTTHKKKKKKKKKKVKKSTDELSMLQINSEHLPIAKSEESKAPQGPSPLVTYALTTQTKKKTEKTEKAATPGLGAKR